ncbi:putative RNA-directed DNA polymerase from mobile element jockey-like [Apostichopus japonicus]|uniref:Putative RNA-directed DNA polymerase from mobile element jockey-like n=1 Tax=Stichopus japonicus TaxID=307972 RepID=A0A2G8JUP7_STIJA|nr:putative RNA-directed DNA polymerase from mobile element jockey-like [Apostichopus japonicus]
MEDVTSSLNRQRSVDVVFLDFQKAFDKVPHQRLLLRLKSMGVIGNLLSWIGNWLGNREQRVVINGCASSWQNVTSGVPQGSVLGPLLFVAYINDIDGDILCTAKKFADDTKLYSEVSSKSDSEKFQADLDKIFSWSQGWQMLFNIDKCKKVIRIIGDSEVPKSIHSNGSCPKVVCGKQGCTYRRERGKFITCISKNLI